MYFGWIIRVGWEDRASGKMGVDLWEILRVALLNIAGPTKQYLSTYISYTNLLIIKWNSQKYGYSSLLEWFFSKVSLSSYFLQHPVFLASIVKSIQSSSPPLYFLNSWLTTSSRRISSWVLGSPPVYIFCSQSGSRPSRSSRCSSLKIIQNGVIKN